VTGGARVVTLSRHARLRLVERGIEIAWVAAVVARPLWTAAEPADPTVIRCFGTVAGRGGRVLRVAVRDGADGALVVPVMWDWNAGWRLRRGAATRR
jgi:hypothetical protein